MASDHESRTLDCKGDADVTPAVSCDRLATKAVGSTQYSDVDTSCDRKWEFRPPPRGLTPNEYALCHRWAFRKNFSVPEWYIVMLVSLFSLLAFGCS